MNSGKLDEEAIKKAATKALEAFMDGKLKDKSADEWKGCETVIVTMEIDPPFNSVGNVATQGNPLFTPEID